ncbi:MAG: radical SAM protein [Candidatus Saliniplasma sp.]
MKKKKLDKYSFEIGPIRPPSEGGSSSLLIRPTRNCSWNRCAYCPFYDDKKFQIREVEEVKGDIDSVRKIKEMLSEGSEEVNKVPYDCLSVVSRWMKSGEKTVFLQDSNSLIMPTDQLVEILEYLIKSFPSIERITSYARSDTIVRKEMSELRKIREAGLTRLHVGLESGDDEVLDLIKKGVVDEQHVEAGEKAKEAGFELSEYIMPGLGGKKFSKKHALNTAKVLNQIDPDYIRVRPLYVYPDSDIYKMIEQGEIQVNSPHERLEELKVMVEELDVNSKLCFDHSWNSWRNKKGGLLFDMDYEGYQLPDEKSEVLKLIEDGLEIGGAHHQDLLF